MFANILFVIFLIGMLVAMCFENKICRSSILFLEGACCLGLILLTLCSMTVSNLVTEQMELKKEIKQLKEENVSIETDLIAYVQEYLKNNADKTTSICSFEQASMFVAIEDSLFNSAYVNDLITKHSTNEELIDEKKMETLSEKEITKRKDWILFFL